jgi:hypothetical protein
MKTTSSNIFEISSCGGCIFKVFLLGGLVGWLVCLFVCLFVRGGYDPL